jgi:stage V sporulation protein K
MSLSLTAQLVIDKAISFAKRSDCEHAGPLHVLAGIRGWNEEEFDHRFPNVGDQVSDAIQSNRGTAIKCLGLEQQLEKRLEDIHDSDDVWVLANELISEVSSKLKGTGAEKSFAKAHDSSVSSKEQSDVKPTENFATAFPFGITEELCGRASDALGIPLADAQRLVLSEAHAVASLVFGNAPESLPQQLKDASLMPNAEVVASSELSTFIKDIATSASSDAGNIATQVALALVEVAEWAAALDENVTSEETDRIDDIRMSLRGQLGDQINARNASISVFEEKFSHLIGMESVKQEIRKRVDFLIVNKRREKRGMGAIAHRMHVAFVGNPGTGKTTVARLYGELLNDLGLLPSRNFVETDRSGLVAEFVGQTEKKTLEQIEKADGGVLFIDECYALNDGYGNQKGFGEEATDCLVKQMEDRRDRLVVILAGYKDPTLNYMRTNPGLQSRVPMVVDFPDYSTSELLAISSRIASSRGLIISNDAIPVLEKILDRSRKQEEFGNARTVENLLETAERNVVNRTSHLGNLATEKELRTITAEDFPQSAPQHKKQIGFGPSSYV